MELQRLRGLLGRRDTGTRLSTDLMLSPRQFQAALHRERLRADRAQRSFALLTVTLVERAATDETLAIVAAVLEQRVRESDLAGWMTENKAGIILPETAAEGGWKLAEDLGERLAEGKVAAKFELYTYPSEPDDGENSPERDGSDLDFSAPDRPVQPLEMLFAQKLPAWKRTFDVAGATLGLLLAAPIMLLAALAVKATSRGPIFYAQQRDGLAGRRFWIYKFRTMVVNADAIKATLRHQSEQDGPAFKLKNDPRVTRVGRLLRRTCVDELPQLWNVLRGDMSIVGPRPMCSKEARQCAAWERRRLDVTPGLTCTWQVHGGTKVTFTEWMRMDLRYVGSRSLMSDVRLMLLTVPSVIRRDGVY